MKKPKQKLPVEMWCPGVEQDEGLPLKTTRYFEEQVLRKRPYLRREWCRQAILRPEHREVQQVIDLSHLEAEALPITRLSLIQPKSAEGLPGPVAKDLS